ncbi:MAG: Asp-tRNA(Asn)/Glu-tRNA(Gln) amidotransferase subunit GatC [Caldicoprobacterales bacterium]|jgi:aspartyl-tRNA(Asn)/glutamyl-tRNA(Gln) amidotransferase subunit C|nr:Asp-tRNA(Asn)/Glu-tRNA(Gln) amidotransferase subunit GatC [Clostridiales bacterium]
MKLSLKDIENMGLWSKLKLDHQEKEVFLDRINKTLQKLEIIKELATDHLELSLDKPIHSKALRDDQVQPSMSRDQALKNAQETWDGMFSVPSILD